MKLSRYYGITELEAQTAAEVMMTTYQMTHIQALRTLAELEGRAIITTKQLQTLNVQRLLLGEHLLTAVRTMPFTPPPENIKQISQWIVPPPEMEEPYRKHILPYRKLQQETLRRRDTTTTTIEREKIRILKLHEQAITYTDQRTFNELESNLYTFQFEWYEKILLKLIDMCKAKQLYLERIIGKEALQKLMLEMYIPFYMPTPQSLNMLSIRLSQAVMQYIKGMAGTYYQQCVSCGQAVKCKLSIQVCQKRKLESKAVANQKTRKERYPTKRESNITESADDKDEFILAKDLGNKSIIIMALQYMRGMPYLIKRWLAHTAGFPEGYKLYRRPHIQFLPTRITLGRRIRRRYTGDAFTYHNRDEYLKLIKKYGSRYG